MRFCPHCHLIMEPAECGGLPISACRNCGGLWFPSGELPTVLALGSQVFEPLADLFPGVSRSEAYAGLSFNCPDCRIAHLEPDPVGVANEYGALSCPKCSGAFLSSGARAQIASPTLSEPEPAAEFSPEPSLQPERQLSDPS